MRRRTTADRPAVPAPQSDDERLADVVYRDLVSRLISREIGPGERISVDGTARRLDVSQTPVRHALTRLEIEGLATRVHLAGYRAAPLLTEPQFEQLFDFRLLLEPFAASQAAQRHTPEQAAAMQAVAHEMQETARTIERPTYARFAEADGRLHDLIAIASGNLLVRDSLARVHAHVHLFRLHYAARVSLEALGEHDTVLSAIARRDPAAAEAAMRSHIEISRDRLRAPFRERSLDTVEGPL